MFDKFWRWLEYGPQPEGWPPAPPQEGEWVDWGHDSGYCHCGTFHEG
jgi:hypothetical protein